ncbi:MAG: S41 family peptidase [Thermoanaerobaculia bacterium]
MRSLLATALSAGLLAVLSASPSAAEDVTKDARLLRFPDVHGDTIVFSHAGDLWTVPTSGGTAHRLTTGDGLELFPRFSPDGKWIAFTGQYDGTTDVYVMPATGGEPKRLTWYPSTDQNERMGPDNLVLGWTPEGKILFRGLRGPIRGFVGEPYVVSPEGGPVERFPLPESGAISFSPDGKKIAYNRIFRDFRTWKRYKGGMAQDVWLYDLASKAIEKITDWPGTDTQPTWIGGSVFFLSDRDGWKGNLWKYDVATKATSRVTSFTEYDVKWPHGGGGAGDTIVFENGGFLYILDTKTGQNRKVTVDLPDDRKWARPRWVKVDERITDFALAPGGGRAVFTARGDVFTVPAENGNTRNVTRTQGVRERNATWSPDGKWIAYWSDASGEEELFVAPQDGKGAPVKVAPATNTWHFPPVWSGDSRKIAYSDRAMRLWVVDVAEKKPVLVDTATILEISRYALSPDGEWLAYVKVVENDFPVVFLHSLATKKTVAVTSSASRAAEPLFDPEGKYLWLFSDRDINPTLGAFEASYTVNKATRPYALILAAGTPSPFAPKSDEAKLAGSKDASKDEKKPDAGKGAAKDAKKDEEKKDAPKVVVKVDLDGIESRLVAFPVPAGNYFGLTAAKGKLFWLSAPTTALTEGDGPQKAALQMYDLEKRKSTDLFPAVENYDLAPDGGKLIVKADEKTYQVVEPKEGLKPGDGKVDLSGLRMELDPPAEWRQIFRETWRLYRDFFYLPDMGKIDWDGIRKRYEPLVAHVSHRYDLTCVLSEVAAELGSGHAYVGGGDVPKVEKLPVGMLGADLALDAKAGRWKVARILPGQNWNENRRSPLTEPGVNVKEGDYLLAIDGRDLTAKDEPYRLLAGNFPAASPSGPTPRTITLLVNAQPVAAGAREVVVRPIGSEEELRYVDWVETNRKKVEAATNGRVGYVHIPNMGGDGLQEFIRQFYPQLRKEALVVDVRANGGGFVSEMILERLARTVKGMGNMRNARPGPYPTAAFNGPMVALISPYSASDGDIFPFYFREYGLGPLIGERTWGGVVGIRGLGGGMVDGGYTFVPEFGTYDLKSRWIMENEGVSPDIEVDNFPADELAGKDAQLDRAIAEVLKRLEAHPSKWAPLPPSKDLANPVVPKK